MNVETEAKTFWFAFVGVSTSNSSIIKIFPKWMKELGRLDIRIQGIDHALHDSRDKYRETVQRIKDDPFCLGALVTTHKMDLYAATSDLFDEIGEFGRLTREISAISKRGNFLIGNALDPLTCGLSLDEILGTDYFLNNNRTVLNFGAGGSGMAISLHFMQKFRSADRPWKFIMVNRSEGRLNRLRELVKEQNTDIEFEYICNDESQVNDRVMSDLPNGSLVINSTGMGKDRPGSPVSLDGVFPAHGIAWELNYRGELDFLHQAMAQSHERDLMVEDGWVYFLHGWTRHITNALHMELDKETFYRLAEIAAPLRPELTTYPPTNRA
jgi:shikimate 5-dehydrogenase